MDHSMSFESTSHRRAGRGVTLMELMVVTVIMFIISAMVLRALAPALEARREREAARMFSVMLNGARNRALELGRPAGVWLERMADMPEACMNIAYAAYPEPYTGDFADSKVELFTYPDRETTNDQYYLVMVRPVSGGIPNRDMWYSSSSKIQQVIRSGDQIRLNNCRQAFNLFSTTFSARLSSAFDPPAWIVGIGVNRTDNNFRAGLLGSFDGTVDDSGRFIIKWWNLYGEYVGDFYHYRTPGSSPTTTGTGVTYQIRRQPVKSAAGAIELPEGAIIDMNYSSVSDNRGTQSPFYTRFSSTDLSGTTPRGRPFLGSGDAPEVRDLNLQPIILVFDAKGAVERLYSNWWSVDALQWMYRPWHPNRDVYFLIGKREKVPADYAQTTAAQMGNNLLDLDAVWVMVDHDDGTVITAENNFSQHFTDTVAGDTSDLIQVLDIGTIKDLIDTNAPQTLNLNTLLARSRAHARARTVGVK